MSIILAIDDDRAILRLLERILARAGHGFIGAASAKEAMEALAQKAPAIDAIILDLGLPDKDGLELLMDIRRSFTLPILVLSARHDSPDKISALDLGADDFVTKPFDGDELLARVRAVLRRHVAISNSKGGKGVGDEWIIHGDVRLNLSRHEVFVRGEKTNLTPKEFALITELILAAGRILTHKFLLEKIWGKAHVADIDYLRVAIRALRLKIEADPTAPTIIINEPSIGYRLG